MASHPAYPPPGPGPSSYYQQSPPPHHVYGSHSPAPRPNYYPYPAPPPPPHMNAHQPGQYQHHHQPGPSRGNHRGAHHHLGGAYNSRGTHHYHNYPPPHQQQQQPHFAHAHVNPALGVHTQHHPHSPQHMYSPQSAKYNQPFTPSYPYPSPTAPVFTPSWQQQPLSPLPKQLSMPPPQNVPQSFYEPPPAPPPAEPVISTPLSPAAPPQAPEPTENPETPATDEQIASDAPSPSTPPPATAPTPEPTSLPQTSSSYSHMGTISTVDTTTSPAPSRSASPAPGRAGNPIATWAIWSRRPQDPSHAPSIIISPRARPPPDVVQHALDLKTPPPSAPASPAPGVAKVLPSTEVRVVQARPSAAASAAGVSTISFQSADESVAAAWASQTNSSVPSSSVTENADTPTAPGSPASSHTSVSISGTLAKELTKIPIQGAEADAAASFIAAATAVPIPISDAESSSSTLAPASASVAAEKDHATPAEPATASTATSNAAAPTAASPSVPQTDMLAAPVLAAPHPTPASASASASASVSALPAPVLTPSPAAPKKSWASLLRPAAASPTSPPGGPGPSRNALPTSSVVGFSIPAAGPPAAVPVSPSVKSALVVLLTSGPGAQTTGGTGGGGGSGNGNVGGGSGNVGGALRIRPRGLVNSGNMCFANAVLQVLVYCPPFHRLFAELGRVLVGPVVGGGPSTTTSTAATTSAGASASAKEDTVEGRKTPGSSATPLVDATIEFLREFAEDRKKKERARARLEVVGAGGSARGKGKEREVRDAREKEEEEGQDDWDGDSFLPTYVYDAMKEKKRFDSMRGGHQEDAEEFFGFYLDTLEEELLAILHSVHPPRASKGGAVEETEEAAPPEEDGWLEVGRRNKMVVTRTVKATESPITRIFGGKFRSTLRAPGQKDSVVVEDWRSLRLDIQRDQIHTIQDALSYISDPQPVQVTQAARPGMTIEAHQQVLIEALPPVLVLHIKRFCYDTAVGGVVKVGKQVRFGPELEIGANIMVPAAKKAQPARYKLFGALYHHGVSASGGHYTLDVLHPNRYPSANLGAKPREGWVRIDDDLVSDVRPEDVFGAAERDDARCAYLLFYRRM